ncbi:hypothetical protein, partial [Virgibacillus alimentarius]|uniref:hypothetical protein n=1 Tax=Virgibacillus alimentarius TaxID=698769 RepID=UPI001CF771DA
PLSREFNPLSLEFNPLSREFSSILLEFLTASLEFNPLSLEFNPLSRDFIPLSLVQKDLKKVPLLFEAVKSLKEHKNSMCTQKRMHMLFLFIF